MSMKTKNAIIGIVITIIVLAAIIGIVLIIRHSRKKNSTSMNGGSNTDPEVTKYINAISQQALKLQSMREFNVKLGEEAHQAYNDVLALTSMASSETNEISHSDAQKCNQLLLNTDRYISFEQENYDTIDEKQQLTSAYNSILKQMSKDVQVANADVLKPIAAICAIKWFMR